MPSTRQRLLRSDHATVPVADSDRVGSDTQQFVTPVSPKSHERSHRHRLCRTLFFLRRCRLDVSGGPRLRLPRYHRDRAHCLRVARLETAERAIENPLIPGASRTTAPTSLPTPPPATSARLA